MKKYVVHFFASCVTCTTFFIFGCCKLDMTFLPWLLVSSIVYESPTHVIVGIFELHNTIGATMAN